MIFELCKNVFFEHKNHHKLKGKIQKTCWITFADSGFIQDAIVIPVHWILAKNDGIYSFSFLFCPFFLCLSKVPRNCQSSLKITGFHNKMKFDFPFLWIELHAGCHKKNTFRMMLEPWNIDSITSSRHPLSGNYFFGRFFIRLRRVKRSQVI